MTYDVTIIGGGIAGMTAAIFAARRELKVLIITRDIGGQLINVLDIENWPGEEYITGIDLIKKVKKQLDKYSVEIKYFSVNSISQNNNSFKIVTNIETISSKSIILAYGKSPHKLNIKGEEELSGRGVSYCVNCDCQFFRDKIVAVVGGGSSALEGAITMSEISQKVYLIHRKDSFRGEEILINKVKKTPNIEILYNDNVAEIIGENKVSSIKTKNGKKIDLDGIFVEIGHVADISIVKDLVEVDKTNQIVINLDQSTSIPGIFAAGDITNHPFKQLVIASGQGATAALSAFRYLQSIK